MVTIVSRPGTEYPPQDDYFSPSSGYPEYRYGHLSARRNSVYEMVRTLLSDSGLDRERYGTVEWNPLRAFIRPGDSVFILCNFVQHRRGSETQETFFAKCIHGSVLRAVADYVLLAAGTGGRVSFGNSPLLSGSWSRVLEDTGAGRVLEFYGSRNLPVAAKDLRLVVAERNALGRTTNVDERDGAREAVEIDLSQNSLLTEIASAGTHFRVSDYDPRRTEAFHSQGSHRYVIHRAVLDANVVVSLSKLKTHEKVGITCGLKGFVGAVGHKDCLAHHRFGCSSVGGDEYSRDLPVLNWASSFHDRVNSMPAGRPSQQALQVLDKFLRKGMRTVGLDPAGSWHGNDTAWRMALDLSRIVHFGAADGSMHDTRQRRNISFIDGIVGGEGNGPLSPRPVRSGTVLFSDDVAAGDRAACRIMGFDPERIPMVAKSSMVMKPGTVPGLPERDPVCCNGTLTAEKDLPMVLGRPFDSPSGWRGHMF